MVHATLNLILKFSSAQEEAEARPPRSLGRLRRDGGHGGHASSEAFAGVLLMELETSTPDQVDVSLRPGLRACLRACQRAWL